jgi:hypothetical protein
MGEAIIMRIDPKVPPKIYAGQMLTIIPEGMKFLDKIEAFIAYIQKKILEDDDARAHSSNRPGAPGAGEPRPTPTSGGDS